MALLFRRVQGVLPSALCRDRTVLACAQSRKNKGTVTWRRQIADVLQLARTQDVNQAFAVAGRWDDLSFAAAAELNVDGLPNGLQLPLTAETVPALLAMGTPAPYGHGTETVLDPTVRKATQIDASKLMADTLWQQQLSQLLTRVANALGVAEGITVTASTYKLLVYTEGGHFKAHQDTEKEASMFGTLVVQLPVVGGHEGGKFVFKHHGKTVSWDTSTASSKVFQYAAFYADVQHELQPITSGARVVMVFNLVHHGQAAKPAALDGSPLLKSLRQAVSRWERDLSASKVGVPGLLCIPLEHQYTEAGLSFHALKGTDAKVASCLSHADAGLDVHIALLWHSSTHHDGTYGARNDLISESYSVSCSVSPYGTAPNDRVCEDLGLTDDSLQWLDGGEVWGSCYVADEDVEGDGEGVREPDEEHHEDWMGNEGCTIERIYRQGMMIIWPRAPMLLRCWRSSQCTCSSCFSNAAHQQSFRQQ